MKPFQARSIFIIPMDPAGRTRGVWVDPGLVLRKPVEVYDDGVLRPTGLAPGELQMRRYDLPRTRGIVTAVGEGVTELAPGDIVAFPPNAYSTADQVSPLEYAMHVDNVHAIIDHWNRP